MKKGAVVFLVALAACTTPQVSVSPSVTDDAPKTYMHHLTFRYVGKSQSFKVPKNVTHLFVVAIGGEGGGSTVSHGGRVSAVLPVAAGETLFVYVGGNGTLKTAGYNGGGSPGAHGFGDGNAYGGGGASDIRVGGNALADRILVSGGGGGQGGWDDEKRSGGPYGVGGKGGGIIGGTGGIGFGDYRTTSRFTPCAGTYESYGGCPGSGGSNIAGGAGGAEGDGFFCTATSGLPGSLGVGGQGGSAAKTTSSSYYDDCGGLGGGGGGGYYGGGGGGEGASYGSSPIGGGGGGGGGSSYVESSATDVHIWRGWKQNQYGLVVFSW
jgi:hypothetical protein